MTETLPEKKFSCGVFCVLKELYRNEWRSYGEMDGCRKKSGF